LAHGPVKYQRLEVRSGETNVLQEVRYEYEAHTRGSVTATADHEAGQLRFRLLNTRGFEVVQADIAAARVDAGLLDELAKRIVGQPSLFV
jgi:hypothetical protein